LPDCNCLHLLHTLAAPPLTGIVFDRGDGRTEIDSVHFFQDHKYGAGVMNPPHEATGGRFLSGDPTGGRPRSGKPAIAGDGSDRADGPAAVLHPWVNSLRRPRHWASLPVGPRFRVRADGCYSSRSMQQLAFHAALPIGRTVPDPDSIRPAPVIGSPRRSPR
jgi:hypothetical protein